MVMDVKKNEVNNTNTNNAIYFNFSYAALKLLGKNLYNNAANAISELVANGLDAKAKNVYVYIDMSDKEHSIIEILDDGLGMDYDDLARKYVWIGRNKRTDADLLEEDKKNVMGRKGIGKLAALYLSNHYYILTKKASHSAVDQWEINLSAYDDSEFPKLDRVLAKVELVNSEIWENTDQGTVIKLDNVDLRRNGEKRIEALKRVFSDFYLLEGLTANIFVAVKTQKKDTIKFEKVEKMVAYQNFYAMFSNTDLTISKRLRDSIAFTWLSPYPHIGKKERPTVILSGKDFSVKGTKKFVDDKGNEIEKEYVLTGWIGIHSTIEVKNALDDRYIRNDVYQPNKLRVYVRNKLALANYFDMHPSTQAMVNYIEGEVSFDILDDDALPDIATSSRQDFLADERVELLIELIDPIVNVLFKLRNDIGQKIRTENDEYAEYLRKKEEEKRKAEEEARKKAEETARKAAQEKEEAEKKQREAEKEKEEAEKKQKEAEQRAEREKQRSQYILNVSGVEDKNIMNSVHSIYNMSNRVKENLDELGCLMKPTGEAKKKLEKATTSNQRILSVSKIISKAGRVIDNNDASQRVNLPIFMKEYITDVLGYIYEKEDIEILCDISSEINFDVKIKPLSFIMVLDNIIGNAIKAKATSLRVVSEETKENQYRIMFIDNGNGIDSSINDIESLFDFGVTTTNGSGLGLYYARKYMTELKGKIAMEPNQDKGVTIILTFGKQKN